MTVRSSLAEQGYAITREHPAIDPSRDAFGYVAALVGATPEMVECQPIRPVPDGTSFASSQAIAPLHTDSQDFLGVSPGVQVMICKRAAQRGGESHLVDGWRLLDRLARDKPALHRELIATPRHHRFYFGDVIAPTVCRRRGHVAWTYSPAHGDALGWMIADEVAREPVIALSIQTGEVLVVDNHRMLHGRAAFDDPRREFLRLLAWMPAPLSAQPDVPCFRAPAVPAISLTDRQRAVVGEMIAGTPPARLARREGIAEAELYRWRSASHRN